MNKLKSIHIRNYKCFKDVSFSLKDINVMIGENNAGKSTAIEAVRLLACGIDNLKKLKYINCPEIVSEKLTDKCVSLNIRSLLIDIESCSYKYNGKKSEIIGYFDNQISVKIVISDKEVYAIAFNNGSCISTKNMFNTMNIIDIFVMPRFSLLRNTEKYIDERRTKRDKYNYLSSWHFRNELLFYKDDLNELNLMLNQTWKNIQIEEVSYSPIEDDYINIYVRNSDFSAEIKNYGSGLQMWIQILWFLCEVKINETLIVLDEPDVFIHADLQRKLYRLVAEKYSQVIIATHSTEIINETSLSNILVVDKSKKSFSFCKNKNILDLALKTLGTSQNLMFTKLQRHNKCLFVEGKDIQYLDSFYKLAIDDSSSSINEIAVCELDGKSNYSEMFGAAKLLNDDTSGTFKIFCILDKDYDENYNLKIRRAAGENNISLYFLQKLEIENYLIIPRIIASLINKDKKDVEEKIIELANSLREVTFDRILQERIKEYDKSDVKNKIAAISRETREYINNNWNSLSQILNIIPGKELKSRIFDWAKKTYKISLSDKQILSQMKKDDIPEDFLSFLKTISK